MAKRGMSDRLRQVRSVNRVDFGPPHHHQDTCKNCDLTKIVRSRFNRAFGDSWSDTWTHMDAPMKIRQTKNRRHEMVADKNHAVAAIELSIESDDLRFSC